MAKPKCKCKAAECEECPEWIFTFADLVMLMMGFFVILWVLKPPAGKEGEPHPAISPDLAGEIRGAFGYVPDPNSSDPIDRAMLRQRNPRAPNQGGKTSHEQEGTKGVEPDVQMVRPSHTIGTGAKVIFEPASTTLSPDSKRGLDEIAAFIQGHTNIYMVKGHTAGDDYAEGTDDAAKMHLSMLRAEAAADYLVSKGVSRTTLRVQGCSTFEPLIPRPYSTPDRSQNRRVEVESTATLVKDSAINPVAVKFSHGQTQMQMQSH